MKIFETISAFQEWRGAVSATSSIGFVPTMGALHAGHESLLKRARKENDLVVLSIFVNPTQFNQSSDFEKYPKTWNQDVEVAKAAKVDVIFAPSDPKAMYADGYRYQVSENQFSKELCGEFREGHFNGVLTVVLKLFQLTKPKHAYFGEKDHQQLSLISDMVDAFFLDVKIVACETFRERSGLAMSSRNMRLSDRERALAPKIYEIITTVNDHLAARTALTELGFKVEYLVDKKDSRQNTSRRYIAAWLGDVRLIDNVRI